MLHFKIISPTVILSLSLLFYYTSNFLLLNNPSIHIIILRETTILNRLILIDDDIMGFGFYFVGNGIAQWRIIYSSNKKWSKRVTQTNMYLHYCVVNNKHRKCVFLIINVSLYD